MMKLNKDGKLEICLYTLFDSMTDEAKKNLVSSLACEDSIIEMVYDQLIHGSTENGWYGSTGETKSDAEKGSVLDKFQRRIAKESSETAKEEISKLERKLKSKEEQFTKINNKYFKIYHWLIDNDIKTPKGMLT